MHIEEIGVKISTTLLFLLLATSAAFAGTKAVPVIYGKEAELDACPSGGEIKALTQNSTEDIILRAGPGEKFAVVTKLKIGQTFAMCDSKPGWIGIVVFPTLGNLCGVNTTLKKPKPYKGKCKSGWVAEQNVNQTSG